VQKDMLPRTHKNIPAMLNRWSSRRKSDTPLKDLYTS